MTQSRNGASPNGQATDRWRGIERPYTADDVERLRGPVAVEHTLARLGAERLWELLHGDDHVAALGALTGGQAVQMAKAGLKAIYLSGWQVAADANLAGQTYPDQSLYPADSAPALVRRLNNALLRAGQVEAVEGRDVNWLLPIVADAEAGFGGPLQAYELMRAMIEAGAAGVHYEDQLAAEKKCGHLGGKVLVPTAQFIRTLTAARLAADVAGVPTVLVARTDALSATLLTSDVDPIDQEFLTGERTPEGFFRVRPGLDPAIARSLACAPYADVLWFETSTPDMGEAREFAQAVHELHPGKLLAYNCSPSFNWRSHLKKRQIASFQEDLAEVGYRFQFVTLAGFHALNEAMFELAHGYAARGMSAYVELQEREFDLEERGYTATRHQREVGAGYFDAVLQALGESSTLALSGSTEEAQFTRSLSTLELRAPTDTDVLTPEALEFVAKLHRELNPIRLALLERRRERQAELDAGALPEFVPALEGDWRVAPAPADLQDRRVEITGPVDRKMMINAMNSGARVFMADFEDACSPTWENIVQGQRNLADAVRGTIELDTGEKTYRLNEETAVLVPRPRGWHLVERHVLVDGEPVSASLFDFGLAFFHNAAELLERGSGPYFYLPKLESHLEARLWNDAFLLAQDELGISRGSIRATVLIETILAAFEMDAILYELREHSAGLNAGRWDYIFSVIKKFGSRPEFVLPDRAQVTMTVPFMRAYTELLVATCHKRGAHAMGGMAAFIPSRKDPAVNEVALAKVQRTRSGKRGRLRRHMGRAPRSRPGRIEGVRPRARQAAEPGRAAA